MAKQTLSYDSILAELKGRHFRPVYYLMGEESYYIDLIANYIADNVLTEDEKEFNQTVMYGADVEVDDIIHVAKRYPMMAEYQVVIVREAQNLKSMDELVFYLQHPLESTILVFCHKNGSADRRKKWMAAIEKVGLVFESKRIKDGQLPAFISAYMKKKKVDVDPKSAVMLSEFIGNDLSRMVGELEKLFITMPQGQTRLTPELVERNVGISKDFNSFELRNALIEKNIYKANQIVKYFEENPKNNPVQMVLAVLFGFFSNLMLAYYAPERTEKGVKDQLGFREEWQARDYLKAMRNYSGMKVMQIIGEIRYCDAKSKGVGGATTGNGGLLRELVFRILH